MKRIPALVAVMLCLAVPVLAADGKLIVGYGATGWSTAPGNWTGGNDAYWPSSITMDVTTPLDSIPKQQSSLASMMTAGAPICAIPFTCNASIGEGKEATIFPVYDDNGTSKNFLARQILITSQSGINPVSYKVYFARPNGTCDSTSVDTFNTTSNGATIYAPFVLRKDRIMFVRVLGATGVNGTVCYW